MKKVKGYVKKYLREVDENGFSLLELVVAVGILLVLTVGGLLAYNGLTRNARVAAVQSAADEVYTGAVAYDSNGDNYKDAEAEWMETRNGDSIEVRTWKDTSGAICAEAEMVGYDDIAVKRGAGCDGVPADNGGIVEEIDNWRPGSSFSYELVDEDDYWLYGWDGENGELYTILFRVNLSNNDFPSGTILEFDDWIERNPDGIYGAGLGTEFGMTGATRLSDSDGKVRFETNGSSDDIVLHVARGYLDPIEESSITFDVILPDGHSFPNGSDTYSQRIDFELGANVYTPGITKDGDELMV